MPYTTNKQMPRIRRDAARLFHKGWSARKIGRHLGYHHTAVMKWVKRSRIVGDCAIQTRSSEPKTKPGKIPESLEKKIVELRMKTKRCTEALKLELERQGIVIPRSTIHRVLDRNHCLKKRSIYKRYHPHVDRPRALSPGDLVQMDTIHLMTGPKTRIYVFTLIDTYSRCTYAKAYEHMNAKTSVLFLQEAQKRSSFHFQMIQTDHGPEFGSWFVSRIKRKHRFTRIGKPNDNAHIERFNRTLQEECLDKVDCNVWKINRALKKYLPYYNHQRIHLGIKLFPSEMVVPRL
jgi:transposase InsO family protein